MMWRDIVLTSIPVCLGGVGWVIAKCLERYKRAMLEAERLRRQAYQNQIEEIRNVVSGLHTAVDRSNRDREAMKVFLGDWARKITGDFSTQLKLHQEDVDELRATLSGLVSFFNFASHSDKSEIKQIGKETFLVYKPDKKGD